MKRFFPLLAVLLAAGPVLAQVPVNVRDHGASGSKFFTTAVTVAGSHEITVQDVGDFQVGQGVMVSRCNVHLTKPVLWGPRRTYESQRPVKDEIEIRGYDGSGGSWLPYLVDVAQTNPPTWRWSDDLTRTWHDGGAVDDQWHKLSSGTEIRFNKFDWQDGYTVVFSARDQLVSRIEKIEGKVITLRDAANRSAEDAVLRHCDDEALQAAVDEAIKQKRNVFVPGGHYRLARGVVIRNATSLTFEGANPEDVVLDISEGNGVCVNMSGGTEVTLRNLTLLGHMGFEHADQAGYMNTQGGRGIWGFYLKKSGATGINGTERVWVENCHARRMSQEAFVSGGPSRIAKPSRNNTKSTTYLRCSAVDCARNGFNDWNLGPENTSILYCRIVDVGGCSWEGASRFVRFIGNYVRNSGTLAMGNLGPANRDASFADLGAGQHIIADNVFEGSVMYAGKRGGRMVVSSHGSTQVIIRNNLFVNFNSPAIAVDGRCDETHYPSANTLVTGNIIDLTAVGMDPVVRCGIDVSARDTIVSDNQIYVRGAADPLVTGLRIREPALQVQVHGNLIRNCGTGIETTRAAARVTEVVDKRTFRALGWSSGIPLPRLTTDPYRGWTAVWLQGGKVTGTSTLEACDPESGRFTLVAAHPLKIGDTLEIFPPYGVNWDLHHNTFTGCLKPVVLDSYGSASSAFRDNLITRGNASGVKEAVQVKGRFQLISNSISGFNEPGAAGLGLYLDRFGKNPGSLFKGNLFTDCTADVAAERPDLWPGK